jgi:uncharacterized protein
VLFWFWFWWVHRALMILVDLAWWAVALRLTKRRLWRIILSVFIAGQLAALVSAMAGSAWPNHAPKAVLMTVLVWHYLGLMVLLPLGILGACAWMIRRLARTRRDQRNAPAATDASANSLTRRDFVRAAAVLAPPLFTIGLTGFSLAQLNSFRVRRFTLAIPALPRALEGITIVHVTDIHLGLLACGRLLRRVVNTTNALRPDLVLMTGDLIDSALSDLSEGIAAVKAMEGRCGLWMVEGNHDLLEDGGEFQRRVKAARVPLLVDESAVTNIRGYPVQLFGLRWMLGLARARSGGLDRLTALQLRRVLRQRQPEAFPILLSHHPHAFDAAVAADLPLTLAGHTHGGQFMLDGRHGLGPAMFRYWSGLYQQERSQMVVSNGIGTWLPFRINAPAEIVHLTLRCTEARR